MTGLLLASLLAVPAAATGQADGLPAEVAEKFRGAHPDTVGAIRMPVYAGALVRGRVRANLLNACAMNGVRCEVLEDRGLTQSTLTLVAEGKVRDLRRVLADHFRFEREHNSRR